ncbi:S41 family peptidase [Moraxella sp. Pampa]|uniref:S41 family peptidase n=1 Tax=Moraxella sp. Pampa TaxID=3111978 RepID=UPI002B41232C|nr:S41 family peptidase [Moraxella sp. Pampa]
MKKLSALTVLMLMMANPLSAQAQLPKPIVKVVNFFGVGGDTSEEGQIQGNNGVALDVLDTKPNTLHGIDGLHQGRVPLNAISPNTLKTFVSVIDLVRREYPREKSDDELFYHAIDGMLRKVDSHAEFLDADAFANLQSFTMGKMADIGIGVMWQADVGHWVITKVIADSPAEKAGLSVGDYLHQVGDVRLSGDKTANDVIQLLSGILGTKVDVTFSKSGRSKLTKTLVRTHDVQSKIEAVMKDGIVIIKLPVFQTNTREQILNKVAGAGLPIQGMIIDVRNNPGGVLESAVDVASLFMRNQVVTQVQGRSGIERVMNTTGSPLLDEIPLIILQNRYSASAAEVLASSLQTQKRALIVGETSYGKGSVQSVIPIGDNQAVKITTAHYLTANAEQIDKIGVKPDVKFNLAQDTLQDTPAPMTDAWLEQALFIMQKGKLETGIEFSPVGGF